ncbi:hypothetical protein JR316_0003691 [Psilocybe cubensis]|uniref:Uncharacterized protein n=2 Tax=Psilocybe cubensis TaxID=181762 RepID=A0ACB8H9N5_PSICU|nr:hypothetical protein JR316_0003691 [Psilocybe cubensis]KAH9484211.1 hypothetical protein JR316_0003691 [Psilocybe cubensis]
MFRLALSPSRTHTWAPAFSRSLVSSNLLSRTWQNETISDLRSKAKRRGLSAKGSKAAIASRIEEYEKLQAHSGTRHASTAQHSSAEVPGNPGLPPVSAADIFNIQIPDLSQPPPPAPIQIPFLPDFWNSSHYAAPVEETVKEEILPKLLIVAGAETHPNGGPSHNLLDLNVDDVAPKVDASPNVTESKRSDGLLDDIAEDLGFPPVKDIKAGLWKLF